MKLRELALVGSLCAAPLLAQQDRMPPIPADKRTPAQQKALDLAKPTRGDVSQDGPFVPLLRSPALMDQFVGMGGYLRFGNSLPPNLVELASLITARHVAQLYEWNAHYAASLKAGIKPEIVAAIADGRRPEGLAGDEETVYNFVTELLQNKTVSDPTYARMAARFGEKGVIDTTALVGYYNMLSLVMNVAHTPPQPGSTAPKITPFPR